jgi:hypothetical protein
MTYIKNNYSKQKKYMFVHFISAKLVESNLLLIFGSSLLCLRFAGNLKDTTGLISLLASIMVLLLLSFHYFNELFIIRNTNKLRKA